MNSGPIMPKIWFWCCDGDVEMKSTSKQLRKALKVVVHTLLTKSFLYGLALISLLPSIILLLFSAILCGIVRLLCRIDIADMQLSTEECDELERQLAHQEIKRVEDVRSDWIVVDVQTSSGKKCSMSLHSIICISGNHAPRNMQDISISGITSSNIASESSEIASCGEHQSEVAPKKASNVSNDSKSHSSTTNTKSTTSKPVLLWLHGLGGTAMLSLGVTGIVDSLIDDYDVYALDLPGLGRSTIEWPEDLSCRAATVKDIGELFVEAFLAYLKAKNLTSVYLVAHSFGAYHAINFAEKHPSKVNSLLVLDPGGVFPIQCKEAALLAMFFKWGYPMLYLRSLGSPGYQIFRTFLILRAKLFPLGSWGKNSVLALSYWYQAQAAQDGAADIIIAKFFDVGYFTASGADPAYRRFLNLKMPVAIGYGERDLITPAHQGLVLSALCGGGIPVYMIKDASHLPMRKSRGTDFTTMINHAHNNAQYILEGSAKFLNELPVTQSGEHFGSDVCCYFSTECTLGIMSAFYEYLLMKRRQSLSATGERMRSPYVIRIDGNTANMTEHHFPAADNVMRWTINRHFKPLDSIHTHTHTNADIMMTDGGTSSRAVRRFSCIHNSNY